MALKFLSSGDIDGEFKIEVAGPKLQLKPTTQNNASVIELGVLNAGTNAYAKIDAINLQNYDTNLRFYTNAAGTTAQVERMRIGSTLISFPTITELRGDIGSAKFAVGNMGDASSQMMVSSRGFLTFNVSNTGSALDALERLRITATGAISVGSTGTNYGSSGQVLTSGGNSNPTWTTPTTGDVTGSGADGRVTFWTGTKTVSSTSGFTWDNGNNYLSINKWTASTATPAAMLHLFGKDNNIDVPAIIIEGRDNPNDTRLKIAVKDPQVRFLLDEGSDAVNGYGLMTFETTAQPNVAAEERGGFDFDLPGGTAMTIVNTGKVGIGTNGPTEKLEVKTGSIFINAENQGLIVDSVSKRVGFMKYSGHEAYISRVAGQDFAIVRTGGTDIKDGSSITKDLNISGSGDATFAGSVTASNTSKIEKAQITTQFDTSSFLRLHPSATTNSGGYTNMIFGTDTANNYGVAIGGLRAGTDGTPSFSMRMLNDSITGTEVLNISNSGALTISGSSSGSVLNLNGGVAPNGVAQIIATSSGVGGETKNLSITNSSFAFDHGSGSFTTFIGNASYEIQALGAIIGYNMYARGSTVGISSGGTFVFGASTSEGVYIQRPANTTDIYFIAGGNTRMVIENNGEVGINNTSPSATLHLTATASNGVPFKLQGHGSTTVEQMLMYTSKAAATNWYWLVAQANSANTIIIYGNGNINNANNSYGQLSDIRLKENVVDATPKLEDIKKLKVKNFNFKGDNLKQIGLIAQEVEDVFPGLVDEDKQPDIENGPEGEVYKSVKYSVLVPILVKAMQEQQEQIDRLEEQIKKMSSKN